VIKVIRIQRRLNQHIVSSFLSTTVLLEYSIAPSLS
jgi:hypothetical protein